MSNKFDIRHKEALVLFLREYFELFFPNLVDKINFESAKFLDKELSALFAKSDTKINESEYYKITDALILIEIVLNSKPEFILIHWEQQSQKAKLFEERMFHYFCGIYFKYRKSSIRTKTSGTLFIDRRNYEIK